jgi:predicted house-cleaning noncanonical NTP pyrophosphatase (MazG superfamily)
MLEKALDKLAEQIIALDEASLSQLRKKYLDRVFNFVPDKEWEKAVIIYFIINGVIAKNDLFNRNILEQKRGEKRGTKGTDPQGGARKKLKVIK